jgi:hypothetical protein
MLSLAAVSVSLAWYATSTTVILSNFNVSLSADASLEIGIKDSDGNIKYSSTVEDSAINDGNTAFAPVSTMFSSSWLESANEESFPVFRKAYEVGKFSDSSTYTKTDIATTGFFTKEMYLKSDKDITLTVDQAGTTIAPDTTKNAAKVENVKDKFPDFTDEEILANLNSINKSMRFGLFIDGNFYIFDPQKTEETYFGGLLDIDADSFYDYDKKDGEAKEILYGEYNDENKIKYGENTNVLTTTSVFDANTKSGVKHVDLASSIANGLEISKENSVDMATINNTKDFIELKENEAKRFVFSIYIEGWDRDSTNLAMYGSFLANFTFRATQEVVL